MTAFLFSCENATCAVPEAYKEFFRGAEVTVTSAEGWEPGALSLGQAFAMKFSSQLVYGEMTRLLIDLEQEGEARWSEISRRLPEQMRPKLVERVESPYRANLRQRIGDRMIRSKPTIHVFVHTGTAMDGEIRLETPANDGFAEQMAERWYGKLGAQIEKVHYRRNCGETPLSQSLRAEFPHENYGQIRLSVSQSFFLENQPIRWEILKKMLCESLATSASELD